MKTIIAHSIIVVLAALFVLQRARAQGTTYLSSLGQPSAGSLAVASNSWMAENFMTGTNTAGYILDSVQLEMAPASGSPQSFTVMLYSAAPSDHMLPGGNLCTLNGSTDPATGGLYTYTASGFSLSPRTSYYIVLAAGTANGFYAWSVENTSPASQNGWETLWGAADNYCYSFNGSGWVRESGPGYDVPQFALTATAVPEPDILYLLGLPSLWFFAWHRWRAKAQPHIAE